MTIESRRAHVAAFWMLGSSILFLALGATATAVGARAPWAWGAAGAAGALLPGIVWRPWFDRGVWAWNGSVRRLAAVLRTYVLRVSYYVLLWPLGLAGSSLLFRPPGPGRSGWTAHPLSAASRDGARDSAPDSARDSARDADRPWPSGPPAGRHGLQAFAHTPGNRWAVSLRPIVFLLTLLRDQQQETAVPGSTYTLY